MVIEWVSLGNVMFRGLINTAEMSCKLIGEVRDNQPVKGQIIGSQPLDALLDSDKIAGYIIEEERLQGETK